MAGNNISRKVRSVPLRMSINMATSWLSSGLRIGPTGANSRPREMILERKSSGTASTGTWPRCCNSSASAISGWMSPRVPKLERTMRMRCLCSVNAADERGATEDRRSFHFGCGKRSLVELQPVQFLMGSVRLKSVKRSFKRVEPPFELELLLRLLAGLEQGCAGSRSLIAAELGATCGARVGVAFPGARLLPKTVAGQEAMFQPGPHRLLEIAVSERVGHRGTDILVGEVDAGNSLIIGGERYRHVILAVDG